ncbi:MAG: FAD-dependent oxidoreductase [Nocardioides sp.]|nr:FAD-dependent oxidoreductase [Nocardioides sp.]
MGCALNPPTDPHWERLSLWHDTVDGGWAPRPALSDDVDADVAIVGAGFTGLWTAYYLAEADPTLRIVVLEAETAGFGASGRNGGWCSALFPASLPTLAGLADRDGALAQHRAMRETVDEVVKVAAAEGIDAHVAKGGTISLARSRAQWRRARAEVAEARRWDRDEDDLRLLDRAEATAVLRGSRTVGATYIHERTRVRSIGPGRAHTADGDVRAATVVRATEGYTASLRGEERTLVPVYSLIIATEPLSPSTWAEIGLARRETFTDHRHLIVYGQRTADDRLVFGGRGAPYHLGSRIRPEYDRDEAVFARLYATLVDLFPMLAGTRVTHAWGGALGIPRDWCASVGLDRGTGLAWAGGYVGDGVSTTNLAGRTLRDLVLDRDTELTRLPWVGHRSPAWEREPLRWLGINVGLRAMTLADAEESVTRLPSLVARAVSPLLG